MDEEVERYIGEFVSLVLDLPYVRETDGAEMTPIAPHMVCNITALDPSAPLRRFLERRQENRPPR